MSDKGGWTMRLETGLPFWQTLSTQQQQRLHEAARLRTVPKGTVLHAGERDCTGLLLLQSGQLRVYSLSSEGREITLYRLLPGELCLFSAPCVLHSIQFDVTIVAEQDAELWLIPAEVYQNLMEQSAAVANVTNEIMGRRFSEVMWLLEQILWQSMDRRLAALLLEERALNGTATLKITHEALANHLGTAREVVTRMLRYFQSEGLVRLSRGSVELLDAEDLQKLADRH